uniref:Transmembrane protein n=1 Tax=Kalanchoe fedtschenkoi TaxID=63787 RepID=A0A7N0ZX76_KALFE
MLCGVASGSMALISFPFHSFFCRFGFSKVLIVVCGGSDDEKPTYFMIGRFTLRFVIITVYQWILLSLHIHLILYCMIFFFFLFLSL